MKIMHWKRSASVLASGAAATMGLVWLLRLFRRTPVEREEWDSPPDDEKGREPGELPKTALTFPDDVEEDLTAADDARHDIGEEPLDLDTASEPEDIDGERMETVHTHEHPRLSDEPYDALDADDLGTEWLFRATESSPPERLLTPEELLEQASREYKP
jgi:hypothetical protein